MNNKTLLVIFPNRGKNRIYSLLNSKTGEVLASHLCSNHLHAFDDLCGRNENRKKRWIQKLGEIDIKFIGETDFTEEKLIKLNKEFNNTLRN